MNIKNEINDFERLRSRIDSLRSLIAKPVHSKYQLYKKSLYQIKFSVTTSQKRNALLYT